MKYLLWLGLAVGIAAALVLAVSLLRFLFGRYEPDSQYDLDDEGRY